MSNYDNFKRDVLKPGIYYKVEKNPHYSQVQAAQATYSDIEELYVRYFRGGEKSLMEGAVTTTNVILG